MKILKLRKAQSLAQGHTASEWQSGDSAPISRGIYTPGFMQTLRARATHCEMAEKHWIRRPRLVSRATRTCPPGPGLHGLRLSSHRCPNTDSRLCLSARLASQDPPPEAEWAPGRTSLWRSQEACLTHPGSGGPIPTPAFPPVKETVGKELAGVGVTTLSLPSPESLTPSPTAPATTRVPTPRRWPG